MKPERLQEITTALRATPMMVEQQLVIDELIAAYEQARAEVERLLRIRDMRENECPKCGDQTWLTVMKTSNISCDYCEYEYDGREA